MRPSAPPRTYAAALRYLYGLQGRGIKFGLRSTRALLEVLGHPECAYPSIHIAGTNGKGSTASMLASIFMESGLRTGLYTSPHLLRFTERIRVNGREIPEGRIVHYLRQLFPAVESLQATFFEVVTAIGFRHFADERVALAVIETGLGGRLDATNVVIPLAGVITTIGLDHQEYLGRTLRSIAREKAGIMKPGVPCITGATQPEVLAELSRRAQQRGASMHRAARLVRISAVTGRADTLRLVGRSLGRLLVTPDLRGPYQQENLRLAAAVCDVLMRRRTRAIPPLRRAAIRRGFSRVVRNTGLRGRCEVSGRGSRTIFDVAHNPDGLHALVRGLKAEGEAPAAVVFGVMKDKDFRSMLRELAALQVVLVPVAPRTARALPLSRLRHAARAEGIRVVRGGSVRRGLIAARRLAGKGGSVLVTGSHYVVGEAIAALRRT